MEHMGDPGVSGLGDPGVSGLGYPGGGRLPGIALLPSRSALGQVEPYTLGVGSPGWLLSSTLWLS